MIFTTLSSPFPKLFLGVFFVDTQTITPSVRHLFQNVKKTYFAQSEQKMVRLISLKKHKAYVLDEGPGLRGFWICGLALFPCVSMEMGVHGKNGDLETTKQGWRSLYKLPTQPHHQV